MILVFVHVEFMIHPSGLFTPAITVDAVFIYEVEQTLGYENENPVTSSKEFTDLCLLLLFYLKSQFS